MEIVRERIDVIFDELDRLPPLPVAVPVAAAHNQHSASARQHGSTSIHRMQLYSLGPTCAPSSWYRKLDLGRAYRRSLAMNRTVTLSGGNASRVYKLCGDANRNTDCIESISRQCSLSGCAARRAPAQS